MSDTKLLKKVIEASEKAEFDKIVKSYLKEVYGFQRIVVTDGKNDKGIDIMVFDIGEKRIQYQVTIQNSALKEKIESDVKKAAENVKSNSWEPELQYFYSCSITPKSMLEYDTIARQYGINLKVYDSNHIAQIAENYPGLQKTILNTAELLKGYKLNQPLFKNSKESYVFDLMGFGLAATIKLQLVEAYILQCLYESGELSIDEIASRCMQKFQSEEKGNFYNKEVNKLYSQEHILKYVSESKKYRLTSEMEAKVERVIKQMELDEQLYLSSIGDVLEKYHIADRLDDVIRLLKDLYVNNFSLQITLSDSEAKYNVTELKGLIQQICGDKDESIKVLTDLLHVCNDNKYLQRICAGIVFGEKVNIDRLEQYVRENKKVYLDTAVALNILCYFFEPTAEVSDNYNYTQAKFLIEYCRTKGIKLYLTYVYFNEVEQHVMEAIRLIPFSRIENFRALGGSSNVFYNHYLSMLKSGEYDGNFSDYLDALNFLDKHRNEYIKHHLIDAGVTCEDIKKKYEIKDTIELIQSDLMDKGKQKSEKAIKNDAIMLEFLGDNDTDVHHVSPLFVTWDKNLFNVRKRFYKAHPNGQQWVHLTPSQFVDRYSLLSFSVNQETITNGMLAILSDSFATDTDMMIDTLMMILNPEDKTGLEYTRRFAEMRESYIFEVNSTSDAPQDERSQHVIDTVMTNITAYYKKNNQIDEFKGLFRSDEIMDEIMKIIEDSVIYYKENQKMNEATYDELNALMATVIHK